MKKNSDFKFAMKCMYWLAISGVTAGVLYVCWEIFQTIYAGMNG